MQAANNNNCNWRHDKTDDKVKEQISVINQITIKTFIITTNFDTPRLIHPDDG
jgi:hypothetical protein